MTTHGVATYPLYWPLHIPRAVSRRKAQFGVDFATAREHLFEELQRLGAADIVVSTNIPLRKDGLPMVPNVEPADPGAALYFSRTSRGQKKPYVLACDSYTKIKWNLRALGTTIVALRSIERHGTAGMMEQAFSGFAMLPAAGQSSKTWREVLGIRQGEREDADAVRARYHELALVHHPDHGGDAAKMSEVSEAYRLALAELAL